MIVVTNRMKTKLGFAEKIALDFTKPGALQATEGFVKTEVLITQNLSEYDELSINMYWENLDYFTAWKNSDAFKKAHKGTKEDSPILGSERLTYKLVSTLEAHSK